MVLKSNKPDKGKGPETPKVEELPKPSSASSPCSASSVPSALREASSHDKGVPSQHSHQSEADPKDEGNSSFSLIHLLEDDGPSAEAIRRGVDFFYKRCLENERREEELERQCELDRQKEKDRKQQGRMERLQDLARERRRAELLQAKTTNSAQRRMYHLSGSPAKATSDVGKAPAPKAEPESKTPRFCQCDRQRGNEKQTSRPTRKAGREERWNKAADGPSGYRRRARPPEPFELGGRFRHDWDKRGPFFVYASLPWVPQ